METAIGIGDAFFCVDGVDAMVARLHTVDIDG